MERSLAVERPSAGRWLADLLHATAVSALSGAAAGIIAAGVGGRIAMRITAIMATSVEQGTLTEADETVGDITLDGTLFLVLILGTGLGVLGGLVYGSCRSWFGGLGAWRGLAFGGFLLAALGWTVIEGDNVDFSTLGAVSANLLMFAAIFVAFGVPVVPLHDWFREHLPRPAMRLSFAAALPLYALSLLVSAMALVAFVIGRGGEDGSEAPFYTIVPAYLIFGMAAAALFIARRAGRFDELADLRGVSAAMTAALAAIALPVAVGVALGAQSLTEMLRNAC
jgi:hypothetical protein